MTVIIGVMLFTVGGLAGGVLVVYCYGKWTLYPVNLLHSMRT